MWIVIIYYCGLNQFIVQRNLAARPWGHSLHFLIQVFFAFVIVAVAMALITLVKPLAEPRRLPERAEMMVETSLAAKVAGAAVLVGVAAIFWFFR